METIVKVCILVGVIVFAIRFYKFNRANNISIATNIEHPKGWIQTLPYTHAIFFVFISGAGIFIDFGRLYLPKVLDAFLRYTGIFIYVAGSIFGVWGAKSLEKERTIAVRIRQGHKLIKTGAYSLLRHPLYFGAICLWMGMSLALVNWLAFAFSIVFSIAFYWRARVEERLLQKYFGQEYFEYQKETPMLFPNIAALIRSLKKTKPQNANCQEVK